jgi:hypothetical protein
LAGAVGDDAGFLGSLDFGYFEAEFDSFDQDMDTLTEGEKWDIAQSGMITFNEAYIGSLYAPPASMVLEFGLKLGVLLEAASFYTDAETVLAKLVEEPFTARLSPAESVLTRTKQARRGGTRVHGRIGTARPPGSDGKRRRTRSPLSQRPRQAAV